MVGAECFLLSRIQNAGNGYRQQDLQGPTRARNLLADRVLEPETLHGEPLTLERTWSNTETKGYEPLVQH